MLDTSSLELRIAVVNIGLAVKYKIVVIHGLLLAVPAVAFLTRLEFAR
jgi:hypothetical protein